MKLHFHTFTFALLALAVLCLGACQKSDNELGNTDSYQDMDLTLWDIAPIEIFIKVVTPDQSPVLSPIYKYSHITATWKGVTYRCDEDASSPTRELAPYFYGLKSVNSVLCFGQLDATGSLVDEPLVIDWGDGTRDTIGISHRLEWNSQGKPYFVQRFTLNGQEAVPVDGYILINKNADEFNNKTGNYITGGLHSINVVPISISGMQYVRGCNDFSLDLFRLLLADADAAGKSLFCSPLSVVYALGMTASGASGETLSQLTSALNATDLGVLNEFCSAMLQYAPWIDPKVRISLVNTFFLNQLYNFSIYYGYRQLLRLYYNCDIQPLDFSSPEALETINAWCREHTQGLIPQLLDELDPTSAAHLLNAVYFRGLWTSPFSPSYTRNSFFTRSDGSQKSIPFMFTEQSLDVAFNDAFTAVRLPFGDGSYQMTFVLPVPGSAPTDVLRLFNSETLTNLYRQFRQQDIILRLPRFETSSSLDHMEHQLAAMGVQRLFTPQAELVAITPQTNLYVSSIVQKAHIIVDEQGAEAAAGTDETIYPGASEDSYISFNRPFLYFITERSTGALFFAGTYTGD